MRKATELIEIPAAVTAQGRTTVPAAVRRMLGLGEPGHVVFRGLADGTVVIANAELPAEADPALGPFLSLLEQDLIGRPQAIEPVSTERYRRARALVEGVEVDLDAALPSDGV